MLRLWQLYYNRDEEFVSFCLNLSHFVSKSLTLETVIPLVYNAIDKICLKSQEMRHVRQTASVRLETKEVIMLTMSG